MPRCPELSLSSHRTHSTGGLNPGLRLLSGLCPFETLPGTSMYATPIFQQLVSGLWDPQPPTGILGSALLAGHSRFIGAGYRGYIFFWAFPESELRGSNQTLPPVPRRAGINLAPKECLRGCQWGTLTGHGHWVACPTEAECLYTPLNCPLLIVGPILPQPSQGHLNLAQGPLSPGPATSTPAAPKGVNGSEEPLMPSQ